MSSFIKQLTVYANVRDPALLGAIEEAAKRLCPGATRIVSAAQLQQAHEEKVSASSPTQKPASSNLLFLRAWEEERGDVVSVVRNPLLFMNQLECYVTAEQSIHSGEVAYALYERQMPVLALRSSSAASAPSAASPSTRRTAVQDVLYHEYDAATGTVEAAIAWFFDFPTHMGRLVAVESDSFTSSHYSSDELKKQRLRKEEGSENPSSKRDMVLRSCHAAVQRLQGLLDESAKVGETPSRRRRVTLVDPDGYPSTDDGKGGYNTLLPRPPARFAHLQQRLLTAAPTVSAEVVKGSGGSAPLLSPGPFFDLLEHNPQVFGALTAFNRYDNRGLLRYLLHRGDTVVLVDHQSSFIRALELAVQKTAQAGTDVAAALKHHAAAVYRFEGHWLEMPLPQRTICVMAHCGDDHASETWLGALISATATLVAEGSEQCRSWVDVNFAGTDDAAQESLTDHLVEQLQSVLVAE